MHKTGTTSIQNSLKSLDDENFYYARLLGRPNHSLSIHSIFGKHNRVKLRNKHFARKGVSMKEASAMARADLEASIEAAAGRIMVLSGEAMSNLSVDELASLKTFLQRRGYGEIEVFAYVRAPYGYMSSACQQKVKLGNEASLKIDSSFPRYKIKFSKFDSVFDREHVHLVKFDTDAFDEGNVVLDFIGRTGIPRSSITPTRKNESITKLSAMLRFQYSARVQAGLQKKLGDAVGASLCSRLRSLDPVRFRLAPSFLKPYIDSIREDIEWMEQRLGQSLQEDLTDEESDIYSEDDLMQIIPGINEKLRALLSAEGVALSADCSEKTDDLLYLIATSLRKNSAQVGSAGSAALQSRIVREPLMEQGDELDEAAMSPEERQLLSNFRVFKREMEQGRTTPVTPLTMGPTPLLNKHKKLIVLWSPKSACTTLYVWFSHVSGFSEDVRNYNAWPHRHRSEVYMKSEFYRESVASGMKDSSVLRVIRDPYSRAVSIYRHALLTNFADADMDAFSGGAVSNRTGYSFQTFLDLLGRLDMRRVDFHFRPQFHVYEKKQPAHHVINVSRQDLFTSLNAFEAEMGLARTDFHDLHWLHSLENKRKAKQEPVEGKDLDHAPFNRRQVAHLNQFPSYAQLLTPEARAKIEAIYKVDFDAYRDYL
jgi:hypothetical protein